jgi:hypothetical protein
MERQIFQIVACYFVGLAAGSLIVMPYAGRVAPVLGIGGVFFALPLLVLVVVVFAMLRDRILRHLTLWCLVAPWLVTAAWLVLEWETNYSHRGHDILWYLGLQNVWERAALAWICASVSSVLFWRWNRAGAQHPAVAGRPVSHQPS